MTIEFTIEKTRRQVLKEYFGKTRRDAKKTLLELIGVKYYNLSICNKQKLIDYCQINYQ